MPPSENSMVIYGVIEKAWRDAAYKRRLLADPEAVLAEAGVPLPAGKRIRAVEETEGVEYFILPPAPSGELSDAQLDAVAAGRMGSTVPRSWCESCETACG